MSIYSALIPKITAISSAYTKNYNDDLKVAFDSLDKFEEEFLNGRARGREKGQREKNEMTTLQSINEDDGEANKLPEAEAKLKSSSSNEASSGCGSIESNGEQRASKKRNKNEVDDMFSPEQDKRLKRKASVKAQSIITKQVNVNLSAKLRRENSSDKVEKALQSTQTRRQNDDEKENAAPAPPLPTLGHIKQEKISLPSEPMDTDLLADSVEVKKELNVDDIAMPPPAFPVPKPRKALEKVNTEEEGGKRRTTRNKKQSEAVPLQPPVSRSARASRRGTRTALAAADAPPAEPDPAAPAAPADPRPKRTRAKKKVSQTNTEADGAPASQKNDSAVASPAEKPRPKRTRRGKVAQKQVESSDGERASLSDFSSPILQKTIKNTKKNKNDVIPIAIESSVDSVDKDVHINTKVTKDMDETVVLHNGVYNHAPVTPADVRIMNETVVIGKITNEHVTAEARHAIMDCTVVLEKVSGQKSSNLTEDNSLLTDDESEQSGARTPPRNNSHKTQPSSAVKEKVQQFEEMASRVTRTKTRAMAKKEEQAENLTPPDKVVKPILSAETLTKMNSLIFNGKTTQISNSASKPHAAAPLSKPYHSSTSKLSSLSKHREQAEESLKNAEDARKKKEAILEAKRELQKRKREEKMAAAAAARNAAERERQAMLEAAARDRIEKQANADAGKLERMKEAERKKKELARKIMEMEERRKAEETERAQRFAEEQRRALALRRKVEEQQAIKKEAAIMAKEMETRQKEYIQKHKMKQKLDEKFHSPLRGAGAGAGPSRGIEPTHMADGFQYLHSDEEEGEAPPRPIPAWSTSKARHQKLEIQKDADRVHVNKLFSVRVHSPDLRDIFPDIELNRLKRTSSAVWRTPPQHHLHPLPE